MLLKNSPLPLTVFMLTTKKQNFAFVTVVTHSFPPIKNIWLAISMYMCGEYIFTGKNDIKSIISVRDPRTVRSGPESLSTKYETWFLESLKKLVPKLVTG